MSVTCKLISIVIAVLWASSTVCASSFLNKPSVVTYWGQNSRGASNSQKNLASYCDGSSDVLIISFVLDFSDGNLPLLNLANSCNGTVFSGTGLLQCNNIATDIKVCQDKGKTILISLGGANGAYGFSNDADAEAFADTLWNIFGAGSSDTRPFGDSIIDGFDFDIEGGGSIGYVAMIKRLRKYFKADSSKKYYITGAPQCPYPDAMLGTILDTVEFDAVNVQFYNNYCSTTSSSFNFETWDKWAKKTSPNSKVKILLGIPGSSTAAGSGYVTYNALEPIIQDLYSTYPSFGGVTLWDASASYANTDVSPNYQAAVAGLVRGLSGGDGNGTATLATEKASTSTSHSKSTFTMHSNLEHTTAAATTNSNIFSHTNKSLKIKAKLALAVNAKAKSSSNTTNSTPVFISSKTTGSSISCVANASKCTTEGQVVCSGNSFATCIHYKWKLRKCPPSIICFSTTDGSSACCDQGINNAICPRISSDNFAKTTSSITLASKKSVIVRPIIKFYKSSRIIAQFSVTKSNSSGFEAIINARRLDQVAFGSTITIVFKVASNIQIASVSKGRVIQTGNQVKIHYRNSSMGTMVAVIKVEGRITSSNVVIAPNAKSMRFSA